MPPSGYRIRCPHYRLHQYLQLCCFRCSYRQWKGAPCGALLNQRSQPSNRNVCPGRNA